MIDVFKTAIKSWSASQPMTHSAAAAYFAVFSLPGFLIILISITTFFLDEAFVRTQIQDYIGHFIGQNAADSIETMINNARLKSSGLLTLLIGGGILLFGATGLFNQLKKSFNSVWNIRAKPQKTLLHMIFNRFVSLITTFVVGFLLLVSMYLAAGMKIFGQWFAVDLPYFEFIKLLEMGVSFLTLGILFTIIFKILPDVRIKITYALAGGVLCSVLFSIGEWGFAKILDSFFPQNVFGAAGFIILIMVWVTYGCMILQFGAEFIKALMHKYDVEIRTTRFVETDEI